MSRLSVIVLQTEGKQVQLDILVENMGRVNYLPEINRQRKGRESERSDFFIPSVFNRALKREEGRIKIEILLALAGGRGDSSIFL